MNERIKEIKQAAGIDYNPDQEGLDLFAELIIQECDKYVAKRFDECEPWMCPGDLLKYFGVEK
jgi:hypothetical protein